MPAKKNLYDYADLLTVCKSKNLRILIPYSNFGVLYVLCVKLSEDFGINSQG